MGQYYIPTFLRKRKVKPQLLPEYGIHPHALFEGLKLGENGWTYSVTMCETEKHLRTFGRTGTHFAYVGDYEERNENTLNVRITHPEMDYGNTYCEICKQAYDLTTKTITEDEYTKWKSDRMLQYFVNHDKKQYVPLNITFTESEISPLAFLCYAGDRQDQYWYGADENDPLIGSWAYDRVAIMDEIPQDYINVEPTTTEDTK